MLKTVGKYEILNTLGSGAMGVVYLARDPIIDRVVAIKVLSPSLVQNARQRERFYQEARTAGKLRHPNIVVIYDCGEDQGVPFIVMEYLEGDDLRDLIGGQIKWTLERKLDFIGQICRGLSHAHDKNVVHRDVKPGNMRVLPDGSAKIMDFGIARLSDSTQTQTGSILGTVAYMAPEQCQSAPVTAATDIWSVGVVLFELLTGHRPFESDNNIAVIHKIVTDDPPPLSRYLPDCPPELELIVSRALAKEPAARYQRVDDLVADIEKLLLKIRLEPPAASHTVPGTPAPAPAQSPDEDSVVITREVHRAAASIEAGNYEDAERLIEDLSKADVDSMIVSSLRATLERRRGQSEGGTAAGPGFVPEVAPKSVRGQPVDSIQAEAPSQDLSIVDPEWVSGPPAEPPPLEAPVSQPPPPVLDRIIRRQPAETAVELPKPREVVPSPLEPASRGATMAEIRPAAPPVPGPALRSETGGRVGTDRRRLLVLLAGFAAVVVLGFGLYQTFFRQGSSPEPRKPETEQKTVVPTEVSQAVSLNVLPWAEILEVTEKASGRKLPELQGKFTPIQLNLAKGEYLFRVRNRSIARELTFSIPVTSGQPLQLTKSFPEFDPNAAVREFGIQ